MKTARILSVCECQARLGADLDEQKHVVSGWAVDRRRRSQRPAPAHSIQPERECFQVGWFCPFCVRNTLRSFDSSGLAWRDGSPAPSSTTP